MRRFLQRLALGLAVAVVTAWLALGGRWGWTKTTVTRWVKDPVTEIEGPVIEKKFVPGIDLLAVCLGGVLVLLIASLFVSKTKNKPVANHP
jgi:multisubunit Na+/H+ antiporter MnhB subunit